MSAVSSELVRVLRRAQVKGVQLALPVEIYPGEGIADAIFRASGENGYVTLSPVCDLLGLRIGKRVNHYFMSKGEVDYVLLSDVLGTSGGADALREIAYIQSESHTEGISFFGTVIRRRSLHADVRRIAPSSLGPRPYQRAVWSLRVLSFDPLTKELLLDRCPVCERKLDYRATWGVECCGVCKQLDGTPTDLRRFPQPRLNVSDEEAIDFFTSLILPQEMRERHRFVLPSELVEFGRGQIFELITAIAVSLEYQDNRKRSVSLKLEPSIQNIALASRAIIEWPDGMRQLLGSLPPPRTGAHRYALRGISKIPFFDERLPKLLRREAEGSIYDRVFSAVNVEKKPVSAVERRAFRDPWDELFRLSRLVSSDHRASPSGPTIDLGTALRASTKLGEVSEEIGLPVPLLVGLYSANQLPVAEIGLEPYFHRFSDPPTDSLEERIRVATEDNMNEKGGFMLLNAVLALSDSSGNPWPIVFNAILERNLNVWFDGEKTGPLVRRLFTADLVRLKRLLGNTGHLGHLSKMPLKKSELRQYFGVPKLVYLGEMGRKLRGKCSLDGIHDIRQEYLLRKEIDVLLACCGIKTRSLDKIMNGANVRSFGSGRYVVYLRREIAPVLDALSSRPAA